MVFSSGGFFRSLAITVLIGVLALAGLLRFTDLLQGDTTVDPGDLVQQARTALEAVRNRKRDDRRPASYDSVMAPLDKLLAQARDLVQNINYDPVGDYQKLFDITDPVINVATEANQLAMNETGPLAKTFRFNQQKAEACQYLASGMWSRMTARQTQSARSGETSQLPPEADVNATLRVINTGLDADPENYMLYYMRGIISRDVGMFASAARDLERALEINPQNADVWNVLGLVQINLKQFDKAEESLEKARSLILLQAESNGVKPGEEYTSIIFNLARFHEGLAVFYARENRVSPSAENQRLTARHSADARKYFQEFLEREPVDSPDAKSAKRLMDGLPG